MKIPYSDISLFTTLLIIENKIETEKLKIIIKETLNKMKISENPDAAEFNAKIAEHNGISVEMLVNSPNYLILKSEYRDYLLTMIRKNLMEQLEFSDIEAWAIIAGGFGLLDHLI